jgi:hypothetical protein
VGAIGSSFPLPSSSSFLPLIDLSRLAHSSFNPTVPRSLLGLPGGRNHPMFDKVEAAAADRGMTLVDGRGDDPDTLGKRLVYVMDSRKFPFYQAEVCEYLTSSRDMPSFVYVAFDCVSRIA